MVKLPKRFDRHWLSHRRQVQFAVPSPDHGRSNLAGHVRCTAANPAMRGTMCRWGAESATRSPGRLVVITGLPGSGKTTLATELAASMPASRMCPDDWMMASGIDLWDEAAHAKIEAFQLTLSLDLLRAGNNVVIEWGTSAREEHDALRRQGQVDRSHVELRYLSADTDELIRRIADRDLEGRWGHDRSDDEISTSGYASTNHPPTTSSRTTTLRDTRVPEYPKTPARSQHGERSGAGRTQRWRPRWSQGAPFGSGAGQET